MPTRLLYEKICESATLAELTGDEERLFHRLVVKADDYGRFHAHPSLLLGACFPLLVEKIDTSAVRAWRDRLADVGLIHLYMVEGREYLAFVTWASYQRYRGSKPKFPPPPGGAESGGDSPQVAASVGEDPLTRAAAAPAERAGGRGPKAGNTIAVSRGPGAGDVAREAAAPPPLAHPPANGSISGTNGLIVPASLTGFHAVMIGTQGYEPSPALFEQITERYGSLDLREEALKIRDWLADTSRNRRQRRATTTFVLKWLNKALDDLPPGEHETPGPDRSDGTAAPIGDPLPELAAETDAPSPTAAEAERIWSAALAELRLGMSQANFESYLAGTEGVAFADDEITVQVGNPLVREALEQRFRQHILRALYDVVSRRCRLRLVPGRPRSANGADSFGHRSMQSRES